VYNVGTGHSFSGYEVASIAHRAMENKGKLVVPDPISQAQDIFASTKKLEKEIGPIEWIDIESGIQQMITTKITSRRVGDAK
jgi:UDP-glucose 4-epimerase